ncbi:MalY/PatB family protein [Beduini massiliensis]|uniref:MalY/PatB family protein n=1 Tax=Beduini massiliensis TaxID=1585974 RepID=UPI00059A93C1|nr:MalY/PatB family protein [Beduini massiliensis]
MYDFSKLTNRLKTGSLKWDVQEDELPMWVADMDFEAAPEIIEALEKRVAHKVFGYNIVPDEYYESIQKWWETRHHYSIQKEWMMFCTGVVPALSSIVRKMTTVGENVLIQSPVYNIFYNSILNNGRHVLSNDLVYSNGTYHIDYEDLENKLAMPQTTLMILCNPHNPIGKIWQKEELKRIGDLAAKYHVIVVSDEIHCDIVAPDQEYIPFASVSKTNLQNSITCIAPTKAFNLAGLQTSCIVVPNEVLRHKVNRGINTDEVAEPNSFAVAASIAAFEKGGNWLDELRVYIQHNKQKTMTYIKTYVSDLYVVPSDATYLLWIDCSKICANSVELVQFIREETGLYVSDGFEYGENGKSFIRMNVACPSERLEDGLERLKTGIERYKLRNIK